MSCGTEGESSEKYGNILCYYVFMVKFNLRNFGDARIGLKLVSRT